MTFEFSLARLTQIAELLKFSNLKDEVECDHIEDGYDSTDEGLVYERFTYCPKCGEKL